MKIVTLRNDGRQFELNYTWPHLAHSSRKFDVSISFAGKLTLLNEFQQGVC